MVWSWRRLEIWNDELGQGTRLWWSLQWQFVGKHSCKFRQTVELGQGQVHLLVQWPKLVSNSSFSAKTSCLGFPRCMKMIMLIVGVKKGKEKTKQGLSEKSKEKKNNSEAPWEFVTFSRSWNSTHCKGHCIVHFI